MIAPKDMNWETQQIWDRFDTYGVEATVEMAVDKYENGMASDEIFDWLVKDTESMIDHYFDRGSFDDLFYDPQDPDYDSTDFFREVNAHDIATVIYNFLVDELDAPDDMPYKG